MNCKSTAEVINGAFCLFCVINYRYHQQNFFNLFCLLSNYFFCPKFQANHFSITITNLHPFIHPSYQLSIHQQLSYLDWISDTIGKQSQQSDWEQPHQQILFIDSVTHFNMSKNNPSFFYSHISQSIPKWFFPLALNWWFFPIVQNRICTIKTLKNAYIRKEKNRNIVF